MKTGVKPESYTMRSSTLSRTLTVFMTFAGLARCAGASALPQEYTGSASGPSNGDSLEQLEQSETQVASTQVVRPTLPEGVAADVADFEREIADLKKTGLSAETREAQDAALADAIELAEQVLAIREEHQGNTAEAIRWRNAGGEPAVWYEVADARRTVADLRVRSSHTCEQRAELENAKQLDSQEHELYRQGEYARAGELRTKILSIHRRVLGDDHPRTLASINAMGFLLEAEAKPGEAESYYLEALAGSRRILGGDHPLTLVVMNNLAALFESIGKVAEAEQLHRETLERRHRLLGDMHRDTLVSINNLGSFLKTHNRYSEAEPYLREVVAGSRRLLGNDHLRTVISIYNLGMLLKDEGKPEEARTLLREALMGFRRVHGEDHPGTLLVMNNLGQLFQREGRFAEAEPLVRAALLARRRVLGDDHRHTLASINDLSVLLQSVGKLAEAAPYARETLDGYRRVLGDNHEDTLTAISNLGFLLHRMGRLHEAELRYREALDTTRRSLGDDHRSTLGALNNLGMLLKDQWKLGEAKTLLREALEGHRRVLGNDHPDTLLSINNMGYILYSMGKLEDAEPYFRKALAGYRSVLGGDDSRTLAPIINLAALLDAQGKVAQAETYWRQALDTAERLRIRVIGDERSRAAYAGQLRLRGIGASWSAMLTQTGRFAEAWSVAERGRARALLDLLARDDRDLIEQARARAAQAGDVGATERLEAALDGEQKAKADATTAEALLAGTSKHRKHAEGRDDLADEEKAARLAKLDKRIAEQHADVKSKRQALGDAVAKVNIELRGLFPDARPMSLEQIRAGLELGELLLGYTWTSESVLLLVAQGTKGRDQGIEGPRGQEGVWGFILAKGKDDVAELTELAQQIRRMLADRTSGADSDAVGKLLAQLMPEVVRAQVQSAERLVVLPDGPLNGIPFEALPFGGRARGIKGSRDQERTMLADGPQIVYAASATMYLNRRNVAREQRNRRRLEPGATVLVLGDPIYDRDAPPEPNYPDKGVLLVKVTRDSNAANAGLSRGDVLLSYGASELPDSAALGPAIAAVNQQIESGEHTADDPVKVTYWRDGRTHETTLSPGRMGVQPSRGKAADGLRSMARAARGHKTQTAEINAIDQIRLHGGSLTRLPGTGREAAAIARVVHLAGGAATLLLREEATLARLDAAASGKRIMHLATHGLTGNSERPYDASLALTQPKQITPDDIGFLRLDDLITKWRGKLKDCELVVLSACDTQRGIHKGTGIMALPWGFFYAGAPTVMASLWQADDTATALLMERFYQNLLGQFDKPRRVRDAVYSTGRPMSKGAALREAKLWLRALPAGKAETLVERQKANLRQEKSRAVARADNEHTGRRDLSTTPIRVSKTRDPYDFSHPYFWAGFILIGDPK